MLNDNDHLIWCDDKELLDLILLNIHNSPHALTIIDSSVLPAISEILLEDIIRETLTTLGLDNYYQWGICGFGPFLAKIMKPYKPTIFKATVSDHFSINDNEPNKPIDRFTFKVILKPAYLYDNRIL